MDGEGNHADRYGRVLRTGVRVKMFKDNQPAGQYGEATVKSLPAPSGADKDQYGFPLFTFDHDGKDRRVADTAVVRIDVASDNPTVAALEAALEATKTRNAALRHLSNTLAADQARTEGTPCP